MINENLNKILKQMWLLDEKLNSNEELSVEEKNFYNANISIIKKYYANNNEYWDTKINI